MSFANDHRYDYVYCSLLLLSMLVQVLRGHKPGSHLFCDVALISAALCNILPLCTTVLPDLNVNVHPELVVEKPFFGFAIWYCLFQPACLAACTGSKCSLTLKPV